MGSPGYFLWLCQRLLLLCAPVFMSTAHAAQLTTFADYERMTVEEQSTVRANAARVVYRRAFELGDDQQIRCLDSMFLDAQKLEVQLAHARLRGRLDAAIENPHPKGRVEYLVAHHLMEVCPPTESLSKIEVN